MLYYTIYYMLYAICCILYTVLNPPLYTKPSILIYHMPYAIYHTSVYYTPYNLIGVARYALDDLPQNPEGEYIYSHTTLTYIHIHSHKHTYTHTHIHTKTHTYTYTHIQPHTTT
jgi:hypothetical protein